jgi:hypothetical protein
VLPGADIYHQQEGSQDAGTLLMYSQQQQQQQQPMGLLKQELLHSLSTPGSSPNAHTSCDYNVQVLM